MEESKNIQIDPDKMSYEQLLELGNNIGFVSKGLAISDIQKIPV